MFESMTVDEWAKVAGVGMAIWSMLRYDVIGHWWHRWDCLSRPVMRNFGTYYECKVCGKRKVTRPYTGPTDRDKRWIAHEPMTYQPWELGPPPTSPKTADVKMVHPVTGALWRNQFAPPPDYYIPASEKKHVYKIGPAEEFVGTSEEYGRFLRDREEKERNERASLIAREIRDAGGPAMYALSQAAKNRVWEQEQARQAMSWGMSAEQAAAGIAAMRDALPSMFIDAMDAESVNEGGVEVDELVGDNGVVARLVMPDGSDFDHDGDGIIEVAPLPIAEPEEHWR